MRAVLNHPWLQTTEGHWLFCQRSPGSCRGGSSSSTSSTYQYPGNICSSRSVSCLKPRTLSLNEGSCESKQTTGSHLWLWPPPSPQPPAPLGTPLGEAPLLSLLANQFCLCSWVTLNFAHRGCSLTVYLCSVVKIKARVLSAQVRYVTWRTERCLLDQVQSAGCNRTAEICPFSPTQVSWGDSTGSRRCPCTISCTMTQTEG